jgi:glutaredoxin
MPDRTSLLIALTIYTRPDCHLCHEMLAVVERVVRDTRASVRIEEVDIASDVELEARYGMEIPVLLVNGKKAAKYRVSEAELKRILASRTEKAGEAG